MLPPILALLLLALGLTLGVQAWDLRRVLPVLVAAWVVAMVTSFIVAGVADDGDIGAFVGSAFVLLALALGLWRLGLWIGSRRTDPRSG